MIGNTNPENLRFIQNRWIDLDQIVGKETNPLRILLIFQNAIKLNYLGATTPKNDNYSRNSRNNRNETSGLNVAPNSKCVTYVLNHECCPMP